MLPEGRMSAADSRGRLAISQRAQGRKAKVIHHGARSPTAFRETGNDGKHDMLPRVQSQSPGEGLRCSKHRAVAAVTSLSLSLSFSRT
ncbi:hypothetical protein PMIN01_10012 [Paraphaeosphaeria minitans]|uniref:Uncharacterized protein n=1 Tax=Paraphaeosphaeria minitans TaxID=565426 RepID=A0A9P6KM14_9PLEO|nr:hypothetical protein PMIN01_10012 [Paraphaeosphaeria minitans]